ncbi:MAG: prepilin peptidase [Myxococcales bacterium]|nr:prepilin peptidase [Myxococcales bacterium]
MPALVLADFPSQFLRLVALLLGLVWGSFLNVVIHRLPRGMSVVRPASHCPACAAPIAAWRNVPVFGWFFLRGRAACCGARISARYPFVELLGAVLSIAVVDALILTMPPETEAVHALAVFVACFALALGLLAAAFIDLEHMIVPDAISLGGTVLGAATFALRDMSLRDSLIGAVVGFVIIWLPFDVAYKKLNGTPGMGLGDAKLLMLAGAWFGYEGALFVLGAGAIQGTAATLLMMAAGKLPQEPESVTRERAECLAAIEELPPEERDAAREEHRADPLADEPGEGLGKARIAFGPFLILATLECLLIGRDRIFEWMLTLA